jgi:hypothetical protein
VHTAGTCTSSSTSHTLSLGCGLQGRPVKMSDARCMRSTLCNLKSRCMGLSGGFANSCYQAKDSCGGCVGLCLWWVSGEWSEGLRRRAETDGLRRLWPLAIWVRKAGIVLAMFMWE